MRKMINTEHIEGRVYEHDLVVKKVQNQQSENYGKDFIAGTLKVAVDEDGVNVIPVHYSYVVEFNKNGNKNSTYTNLKRIIDEGKVWVVDGKDDATKVKIDTSVALNDFYTQNDEHISVIANEGGFATIVTSICDEGIDRHKFTTDMLITTVKRIESEDLEIEPYVVVKGAIFDFRNQILPVEFRVRNNDGMNYFESLEVSSTNPVFTKVWGKINNTVVREKRVDESAFGEPAITYVEKTSKEWLITGVAVTAYDFGDENVLTTDDVVKAMQDREVMLAERKRQQEEYRNNKTATNVSAFNSGSAMNATTTPVGGFNF